MKKFPRSFLPVFVCKTTEKPMENLENVPESLKYNAYHWATIKNWASIYQKKTNNKKCSPKLLFLMIFSERFR